jgi:hypothetical protein
MFFALSSTLQPGIRQMTNFLTIKHRPSFTMKYIIKILNEFNFFKVNKSIPNITLKFQIYWQVKEVKFTFEFLINLLKHQFFIILIRNVLYHNCSLSSLSNKIPLNLKRLFIRYRQSLPHTLLLS